MRKLVALPAPFDPTADDLTRVDLEIDAIHHAPAAHTLHQPANF
jgi:hypothetical protein